MKKTLGGHIVNRSIQYHNKHNNFNSSNMQKVNKTYFENSSILKRSSKSFQFLHCNQNKHQKHNQKILQLQNTSLMVIIMYKKKKISLKVDYMSPFKMINRKLFQELTYFQMEYNKLNSINRKIELFKIKGFKTLDKDINFDYRLSLQQGALQNNVFLTIFQKYQTNIKQIIQPQKLQNLNYKNYYEQKQIKDFYEIYNCLAIGGFSKVYLARSYQNGKFYAIKFVRKQKFNSNSAKQQMDQQKQTFLSFLNEVQICKKMNHPFIIKLHHAFQTKNFYAFAFQYCPGGQLFFLLKKVKIMSQQKAKFYFIQIIYAIQYLHKKNIIYRDLKPENILIDYQGNLKIVDFGLSKSVEHNKQRTHSYCGSTQYMAPQMILRSGHSFSIDYYSLGTLLYELVTGLPPFYTKDQTALQKAICCKQLTFPRIINLSDDIKDFLSKLLNKEQKYRLGSLAGIKQILFHPWIGKINTTNILKKQIFAPYPPNLKEHNFDQSQLGQDLSQFTNDVIEDFLIHQHSYIKKNKQFGILNNFYHQSEVQDKKQNIQKINQFYQAIYETQPFKKYIQNAQNLMNQKKNKQESKKVIKTLTFYMTPSKLIKFQQENKKSLYQEQKNKNIENQQDTYNLLSQVNQKAFLKNVILKNTSLEKNQKIKLNPVRQSSQKNSQNNSFLQSANTYNQMLIIPQTNLSSQKFKNKRYQNRNIRINEDKVSKKSYHFKSLNKSQTLKKCSNFNKTLKKQVIYKNDNILKPNSFSRQQQNSIIKTSLQKIKPFIKEQKHYNEGNKILMTGYSTPLSKLKNKNNFNENMLKIRRKVFVNSKNYNKNIQKQETANNNNKSLINYIQNNYHSYIEQNSDQQ